MFLVLKFVAVLIHVAAVENGDILFHPNNILLVNIFNIPYKKSIANPIF